MILHIRLRPDGNGDVFTGTPEEVKKHFEAFKRTVDRSGPRPNFHTVYEVQVWEAGSKYRMMNCKYNSEWTCYKVQNGKQTFVGYGYQTFSGCFKNLQKLMAKEG